MQFTLPDEWGFDLPVWIAVDSKRLPAVGLPDAYNSIGDERLGLLFTFFTDEASAQQFIEEQAGWEHIVPHPLDNPIEFFELIEEVGSVGCTKVVIDGSFRGERLSRVYDLSEFLAAIKGDGDDT